MSKIVLPEIQIKKIESFIEKTYRKNVINNDKWPEAPEDGWVEPENWYSRIHDIIRTMFVVKYIDGVKYLTEEISLLCEKHCLIDYEAREEGYYAVHINIPKIIDISGIGIKLRNEEITFEIQVTTQLQELIRKLLHKYYEENRVKNQPEGRIWQWDYLSDEFSVNYIGHILHYIEGMIVEVRDSKGGSNGTKVS